MSKQQSEFNKIMSECATVVFKEKGGRVFAEDVLAKMEADHQKLIQTEMTKNWRQNALGRVTRYLKATFVNNYEKSQQLSLPGLPAPAAIAVKEEERGQYAYVLLDSAQWSDLVASEMEKDENIENAVKSKKDWRKKLDYLQPVMEGTSLSVLDAIAIIQDQKKAAE